MSKKKNKNKKKHQNSYLLNSEFSGGRIKSKKALKKDFVNTIDEIESYRIRLYEADKKGKKRKKRKEITKEEKEFFTNMEGLKERQKISKDWEKNGFLDRMIHLLKEAAPLIKTIGKLLASLILAFLSMESIKEKIKPETLSKLSTLFNVAVSL